MATVTKTPAEYNVCLEMSRQEAEALRSLLAILGGPTDPLGRLLNPLFHAMSGIKWHETVVRINLAGALSIERKSFETIK